MKSVRLLLHRPEPSWFYWLNFIASHSARVCSAPITQSLQKIKNNSVDYKWHKKRRSGQLRIFKNKFRLAANWYHYNRKHTYTRLALSVSHFKCNSNNNYLDYGPNIAFYKQIKRNNHFQSQLDAICSFVHLHLFICFGFARSFCTKFLIERKRERASESSLLYA